MTKLLTVNGDCFDFAFADDFEFSISTIAHALSNLCRFTGHTRRFYSVAQHSVLVSRILPPELRKAGLLHDAAEAFIGDVATPIKKMLPFYQDVEHMLERIIFSKYDIPYPLPPEVKKADQVLFVTERRDLFPPQQYEWMKDDFLAEPLSENIAPWEPQQAFLEFMNAAMTLKIIS